MEHPRRAPLAVTALLVTATLATSCAAGPRPEASPSRPPAASGGSTSETLPDTVVPTAASAAAADGTGQNRGGSGRTPALTARRLPADWPSDLPVPPGQLQGSTGAAGQWTALILVSGSAVQVKKSAVDFYLAAGFRAETDSILRRGPHRITLVVENRDHSPTNTYLAIGVTTG
jgi:hypothetical protein